MGLHRWPLNGRLHPDHGSARLTKTLAGPGHGTKSTTVAKSLTVAVSRRATQDMLERDPGPLSSRRTEEFRRMAGSQPLVTGGANFLGNYLVQATHHHNHGVAQSDRIPLRVFDSYVRCLPSWVEELDGRLSIRFVKQDPTLPLPAPGLKLIDQRVLLDFAHDIFAGRDIVAHPDGTPPIRTFYCVADAIIEYYRALVRRGGGDAYERPGRCSGTDPSRSRLSSRPMTPSGSRGISFRNLRPCVNNWWVPFAGDSAAAGIQFHPNYEQKPVWNTSEDFDAYQWNRTSRRDAVQFLRSDPRPNPQLGYADPGRAPRVAGDPRSLFSFLVAHLYSSVPNDTDGVRLNFDFRTVRIDHLIAQGGPENVESSSTPAKLSECRTKHVGCVLTGFIAAVGLQ
jgi:hypothetical protein